MCKYECKCMWNMSTSEENPKWEKNEKKDKYYQWLQVDVLCGHATGKACF